MTDYKPNMNINNDTTETLRLLKQYRNFVTEKLSRSLAIMLVNADDVLFDLGQKNVGADHHFYFDAMREIRLKKSSIEATFRNNLTGLFNTAVKIDRDFNQNSMVLPGTDKEIDIEETIAINSTVSRTKQECYGILTELDQRMNEILDNINVKGTLNPVRPEVICSAFQGACLGIESGIRVKLILFKLFEKYVTTGLHEMYMNLNKMLMDKTPVKQNVQPKVSINPNTQTPKEVSQIVKQQNIDMVKDKNQFVIANQIIRKEITQHAVGGDMPEFVKEFLFNHWTKLMMKIYIKEGVESMAWVHALEVVDDLVNCVGGKTSMNEKLNLAPVMPGLVQRLKYGMNVIPLSQTIREEFLTQLNHYHSDLLVKAKKIVKSETQVNSEDVTVPAFRIKAGRTPFWDELLVDNKPGNDQDFKVD